MMCPRFRGQAQTPCYGRMQKKRHTRIWRWHRMLVCLLIVVGRSRWTAAEEGIPPDSWPRTWFQPPKLASERGIASFHESPMLAERVARGTLPPLRKRLPDDPYVIEPAERIGRYGGTLRVFDRDGGLVTGLENPLTIDPTVHSMLPNLASGWAYREGGKVLTLFLRPGLKWSNGYPFTSEDFLFWFTHILQNKELTPVIQPRWQGAQVTALGAYAVRFAFPKPYPFLIQELAHHGSGFFAPAHFMKRYHPDFVNRNVLEKKADREGFISW